MKSIGCISKGWKGSLESQNQTIVGQTELALSAAVRTSFIRGPGRGRRETSSGPGSILSIILIFPVCENEFLPWWWRSLQILSQDHHVVTR